MIASEITFLGSLEMPSHRYNALLELVGSKKIFPEKLITKHANIDEAGEAFREYE